MPKVLIIEQEENIGRFWKEILSDVGVYSIYTISFDSALVLLSKDKYDAVLIDPVRWDRINGKLHLDKGIELVKKIKERHKGIPIIVYSGIDTIEDYFSPHGIEADGYVLKSPDKSGLILELSNFISIDADLIKKYTEVPSKKVKIFICYTDEDFTEAYAIYEILRQENYSPWIDKENILPGQDWELEIEKAIQECNFFLACMSKTSVDKEGYVQKELKKGLEILDKKPTGAIYIIPVRLEKCKVPLRFEKLHWCDFFQDRSVEKLLEAIRFGCKARGIIPSLDFHGHKSS